MGGSLLTRLAQQSAPLSLAVVEPRQSRRKALQQLLPAQLRDTVDVRWWGSIADIEWHHFARAQKALVLLAVKPQDFNSVGSAIARIEARDQKIEGLLSIMAGLSIATIQRISTIQYVARAMPNIAAQYAAAAIGLTFSDDCSANFQKRCSAILAHMGTLYSLSEEALHSITAISGSGIAFVLQFIHHLTMAGVQQGFAHAAAQQIAIQTAEGALTLLKEQPLHPQEWIARICSPAGTTIAGIEALERNGFGAALLDAVAAVARRSRELGH